MICLLTSLVFDFELADGDGGLTAVDPLRQWEYGAATSGPMTGPVWGTQLAGDYLNDADATLQIPLPDLTGAERPVLVLEHWFDLAAGDRGLVRVDRGSGFEEAVPIGGYPIPAGYMGASSGWVRTGIDLSGLPAPTAVQLHLEADAAGRADGWYVRDLRVEDGDPIPPAVTVISAPVDNQDLQGPHLVDVEILEDVSIERAELSWVAGTSSGVQSLVPVGSDRYIGGIPALPPDTIVSWTVQVEDCTSSTTAVGDPFRVFLAAPEDFAGPAQPHVVGRTVPLTWSPPDSPHVPFAYEVANVATAELFGPVAQSSIEVPLTPGEPQDFVVRALYDAGPGDPTAILSLDVEVPELTMVEPHAVFGGDRVYVEVEGRSLYLLDGLSTVTLGEGVTVESFDVLDVNRGVVLAEIAPDAEPGLRDLVITGAQGVFGFDEALMVIDGDAAPGIESITPDSIVQGEEVEIRVVASEPFAGPVTVTIDDELISGGSPEVDGAVLTMRLAAIGRARPGQHDLVFDDGQRLWSVTIEVDEFIAPSPRRCSAIASPTGIAGLEWLSAWRRR